LVGQALAMLYGTIGDRFELAADLAQAVLIKVAATRNKPEARFDPNRGTFKQWVLGILRNTVNSFLRHNDRREIPEADLQHNGEDADPRLLERLEPASESPLQCSDEQINKLRAAFHNCLDRLPRNQRLVIALVYIGDVRQTEVAELMGVCDATITNWKQAALADLTNSLQGMGLNMTQDHVEAALKSLADLEADDFYHWQKEHGRYWNPSQECPPLPRFLTAIRGGWTDSELAHVRACEYCQRTQEKIRRHEFDTRL
jgi:RNA polymerase sigma factor (sigma-70 family)